MDNLQNNRFWLGKFDYLDQYLRFKYLKQVFQDPRAPVPLRVNLVTTRYRDMQNHLSTNGFESKQVWDQ